MTTRSSKSGHLPGEVVFRWTRNAAVVGFLAGLAAGMAALLT